MNITIKNILIDYIKNYKNMNHDDLKIVNDSYFYLYFDFIESSEYLETVSDYLEETYGLINNHFNFNNYLFHEKPILIDYTTNYVYFFNNIIDEQELIIYNFLKKNYSIYTQSLIATNSNYLKPVILMLYNQSTVINLSIISYILTSFLYWGPSILSIYCKLKKSYGFVNVDFNMPFNFYFINNFFSVEKNKTIKNSTCYLDLYNETIYLTSKNI